MKKKTKKKIILPDLVTTTINVDMEYEDKKGKIFILKQIIFKTEVGEFEENDYGMFRKYIGYWKNDGQWKVLTDLPVYNGDSSFSDLTLKTPSNAEQFIMGKN